MEKFKMYRMTKGPLYSIQFGSSYSVRHNGMSIKDKIYIYDYKEFI